MSIYLTVAMVAAVLASTVLLWRIAQTWWRFRGDRVITCPENERPAGVRVNAIRAASSPFAALPPLQLRSCSRWPERAGCGQECLQQISASPEDCLVRNILVEWYAGKRCVACGDVFGEIPLGGAQPAVLRADQTSVEWSEIPADRLPETLAAASPICFACHMTNLLVRKHPELVVDRHRGADRGSN